MKLQQETVASIKQLVEPEAVLNYLGFHIVKRSSKELRGPCKVHGGDNPTAFRFSLESRTWCCYTRHCEGDADRDLIGLVQKTQGLSFVDSVRFLADLAGVDLENQESFSERFLELKRQQEIRKEVRQSRPQSPVTSFFPEQVVEELRSKRSNYFLDRGFPENLLDFYDIGGMLDNKKIHRDTIPIRDEYGNLLTISGRRTDSNEDPKYLLLQDLSKGVTLYNLHLAKEFVGDIVQGYDRTLILVEGFVDVWALAMLGVFNVVAAMGVDITPEQARLLGKYAENVTVMLDADEAGRAGAERVRKLLEKKDVSVTIVELPDGKDPKNFTYKDMKKYFGGIIYHG